MSVSVDAWSESVETLQLRTAVRHRRTPLRLLSTLQHLVLRTNSNETTLHFEIPYIMEFHTWYQKACILNEIVGLRLVVISICNCIPVAHYEIASVRLSLSEPQLLCFRFLLPFYFFFSPNFDK